MKISRLASWGAGLALLLSATALSAQGWGMMGRGGMMGGGRMGGSAQCAPFGPLNLTEAQQASAKTIRDRHKAALDAKLKTAGEAREELRKAMDDPATSDARIKELHTKVSDAMVAVMLERRAMEREFEAILTPDQKAALDQQRQQGGPGGRRGWGHPGGCGFGGGF